MVLTFKSNCLLAFIIFSCVHFVFHLTGCPVKLIPVKIFSDIIVFCEVPTLIIMQQILSATAMVCYPMINKVNLSPSCLSKQKLSTDILLVQTVLSFNRDISFMGQMKDSIFSIFLPELYSIVGNFTLLPFSLVILNKSPHSGLFKCKNG